MLEPLFCINLISYLFHPNAHSFPFSLLYSSMDMLNMDDFDAELFHLQESSTNRKQPNIDQEHSYLHYLQTTAQDFFYDPIYQQQYISNMPNIGLNLDMPDYTFSSEQKSQYNWLCDPNNTLLCDDSMMIMPPTPTTHNPSYDCIMSESDNIMVEGGMSRGYVSLSVSTNL
jgi:hypothetical protein